jgi:hypothetical protein
MNKVIVGGKVYLNYQEKKGIEVEVLSLYGDRTMGQVRYYDKDGKASYLAHITDVTDGNGEFKLSFQWEDNDYANVVSMGAFCDLIFWYPPNENGISTDYKTVRGVKLGLMASLGAIGTGGTGGIDGSPTDTLQSAGKEAYQKLRFLKRFPELHIMSPSLTWYALIGSPDTPVYL